MARILIVEDNSDSAQSFEMLLNGMGHKAHYVIDSRQALGTALRQMPDVVFVDVSMPGIDGWAVVRMLRLEPSLSAARIYVLSAFGSVEDRQRSESAGANGHLMKPVDPAFVASLLGKPAA